MENQVFDRLAPFLREFMFREAWQDLRPVQVEAIQAILDETNDVLITTGTASGKTEAAFLPVLNQIHKDPLGSVRVLYVGPLRALINDQFRRLEPLCEEGGIPIHRWHGDIDLSHKKDLLAHPGGILQITPESIESLLINKTKELGRLFHGLLYIVIDEVHSFLQSDRGTQLRSQLERLTVYATGGRPRRIGLSATVGDMGVAQAWLNPLDPGSVHVIHPAEVTVATRFSHLHFPQSKTAVPPALLDDLYGLTRTRKALIFCNSRETVELVTVQLNRLCTRDRFEERYLPHHGSISKEIREDAEQKMKEEDRPCSVVCTNTLELGIDIGQLDLIVQINSTQSVMSFVQRLGRSGRRPGAPRMMQVYTSEHESNPGEDWYQCFPFELLKGLAVTDLFLEGWVEPPRLPRLPYHILCHQILSRVTERYGQDPGELVDFFVHSGLFPDVGEDENETLIQQLLEKDLLERMPEGELILGVSGDRIVHARDFYAVFFTPPEWDVRTGTHTVGRIRPSPELAPGACLLLGGRIWEVKEVLAEEKQVLVAPAAEARNVLFAASGIPEMHPRIAERARDLLFRSDQPKYLSEAGQNALSAARRLAARLHLETQSVFRMDKEWILLLWTGTRAARTIQFALRQAGIASQFPDSLFPWVIAIPQQEGLEDLRPVLDELLRQQTPEKKIIESIPRLLLLEHKYDEYLPEKLLRSRAEKELIDWKEASALLTRLRRDLPPFFGPAGELVCSGPG